MEAYKRLRKRQITLLSEMADTFNKAAIRIRCANLPFFLEVYAGAFVSRLKAQLDTKQK